VLSWEVRDPGVAARGPCGGKGGVPRVLQLRLRRPQRRRRVGPPPRWRRPAAAGIRRRRRRGVEAGVDLVDDLEGLLREELRKDSVCC
jgi:hypothetical protein